MTQIKFGFGSRVARGCGGLLVVAALLLSPTLAAAHDHDPQSSGHPLEVLGTLLYPVGWLLDTVIVRPLHWLGNREPFSTVTGHEQSAEGFNPFKDGSAHHGAHHGSAGHHGEAGCACQAEKSAKEGEGHVCEHAPAGDEYPRPRAHEHGQAG